MTLIPFVCHADYAIYANQTRVLTTLAYLTFKMVAFGRCDKLASDELFTPSICDATTPRPAGNYSCRTNLRSVKHTWTCKRTQDTQNLTLLLHLRRPPRGNSPIISFFRYIFPRLYVTIDALLFQRCSQAAEG